MGDRINELEDKDFEIKLEENKEKIMKKSKENL